MIRVKIDLIPKGIEAHSRELARIEIENITGDGPVADYLVKAVIEHPNGDVGLHNRTLLRHPRRALNVFGLVTQALAALGPNPMRTDDEEPDSPRQLGD